MKLVGLALFFGLCAIGFGSWFFAVVESIGIWKFWPWVYRRGVKIVDENISLTIIRSIYPGIIDVPKVKAKVRTADEILFRVPFRPFGFKVNTPFPIKATLILSNGNARMVGRMPMGTVGFFGASLIGWTIGGCMTAMKEPAGQAVSFILLGWAFVAGIVAISVPLELRRIRVAKDALLEYLGNVAR